MSAIPHDLLEHWPDSWALPQLWARLQRGEREIAPDELVRYACEAILDPVARPDAITRLIDLGEFAAAEEFLFRSEVEGELDSRQIDVFTERLREARAAAVQRMDERGYLLRERCERLGAAEAELEAALAEARRVAAQRSGDAETALLAWESRLSGMERDRSDALQGRLQARLADSGPTPPPAAWIESIRNAIGSCDFQLAEFLLEAGASDEGDAPVPWRRSWPYGRHENAVIMRWFLGEGEGIPRSFPARWGVPYGDPDGERLLMALQPLVTAPDQVGPAEAGEFLGAVARCLGASEDGPLPVSYRDGGYWGRVRGLRPPGFYAFSGGAYDSGVAFLVPSPREPAEEGAEWGPAGPREDGSVPTASEAEFADGAAGLAEITPPELDPREEPSEEEGMYLCFHGRGDDGGGDWPPERAVQLSAEVFFRLLGDENRAHNLVREIGTRLSLASAFPGPFPVGDGRFVVGREKEQAALLDPGGPVLWMGPTGSGRSTLLAWAVRVKLAERWVVLRLLPSYGPGGLPDLIAREIRRRLSLAQEHAWTPGSDLGRWLLASAIPGMLIVVDDVDDLPDAVVEETLAYLVAVQGSGDGRIRCLASARPSLKGRLPGLHSTASYGVSPYLDFRSARKLVRVLSDWIGIVFEPVSSLDRMLYFSGGHVALLHQLFWELLMVTGERVPGSIVLVSPAQVDRAFGATTLRSWMSRLVGLIHRTSAADELDESRRSALLRMMLASMLLERTGSSGSATSRVIAWPEVSNVYLDDADGERALETLAELGLVIRSGDRWRLPPGGFQALLAEVVGVPEMYLEEAISDWRDD